jgi:hypothetical protein
MSIHGLPLDQIIFALDLSLQAFNDGGVLPASFTLHGTFGGGVTAMPKFVVGTSDGNLYIVIRGSTEPHDFALNLQGTFVPFLDGCAHAGVLAASRWTIAQARQFIDAATGQIIVTGHSLGGSASAVVAAILALEEKRPNVIAIAAASFPVISPNLQHQTEPFITSLVFARDIVPQLTGTNCKNLLLALSGNDPSQAAAIAGAALVQLFSGILRSRGVTDQSVYEALSHSLPAAVPAVLNAPTPPFELRSGGSVWGINRTADGGFSVDPYEEGRALTMPEVLVGVVDHTLLGLVEALRAIPRGKPTGPVEVEDLD